MIGFVDDDTALAVALEVERRGLMAGVRLVRSRFRWAQDLRLAVKVAKHCVERCGG